MSQDLRQQRLKVWPGMQDPGTMMTQGSAFQLSGQVFLVIMSYDFEVFNQYTLYNDVELLQTIKYVHLCKHVLSNETVFFCLYISFSPYLKILVSIVLVSTY